MDPQERSYNAPEVDRSSIPSSGGFSPQQQHSSYASPYSWSKDDSHKYSVHSESPATAQSSFASDGKNYADVREIEVDSRQRKLWCGIQRRTFVIILIVLLLLIIAGVVVGVVVGVVLPDGSTSSPQPQPQANTSSALVVEANSGFAITKAADTGKLYAYFQNPDGGIYELAYHDEEWSTTTDGKEQDGDNADDGFVTNAAAPGSPLAAISYVYDNNAYRQIFFITGTGSVKTVNRSESGGWSSPTFLNDDITPPGSIALAALVDDRRELNIRVFYGVRYGSQGAIRAVGNYLDGSDWTELHDFDSSDPMAGVGCNTGYYGLSVYLRDPESGKVQQWRQTDDDSPWSKSNAPTSPASHPISDRSDIAACHDESDTEYIFYRQAGGGIIWAGLADWVSHFDSIEELHGTGDVSQESKLAAVYVGGKALVMFQKPSDTSEVWTAAISRYGDQEFPKVIEA